MQNLVFLFLTVGLLAGGLSACGSKKETNSSVTGARGGNLPPLGSGQFAECTRVAPNNMYFNAELASYYYAGTSNNEYIQMNISDVPAEFYSNSYSIEIFRLREPTAGARTVNQLPTQMYYVSKLTGAFLNSSPITSISRSSIESFIDSQNLSALNITASNFFENYYILLTGMEMQWEAVEVRLLSGGQTVSSSYSLLTPFYADPNVYSSRVPVPFLQSLHPLVSHANSGASEAEFKRLADEICMSFFGTVRNTASVAEMTEPQGFMGWLKGLWNKILSWF